MKNIAIIVAAVVVAGAMAYGVMTYSSLKTQEMKQASVQGCLTLLPDINPGWYNKCMTEKGYTSNLSY